MAALGSKFLLGCLLAVVLFATNTSVAQAEESRIWQSGRFSFSDELGGFRITDVTGSGTRSDPYYIKQVFDTAQSATLVIRTHALTGSLDLPNNGTHSAIHLLIETQNNSNLAWIGFGFELQEKKEVVSDYGDGLSFDQLGRRAEDISSDRFSSFEKQFEPGDRLVYTDGFVNNQTSVTTRFVITDFTPVDLFYLFQDPLIPAS